MARYTYLACDLLTNAVIDELPLTEVEFSVALNGAGEFSAKLPIADPKVQKLDYINATIPGRTIVYVDRDGVLIGAFILWTRKYDSSTLELELDGQEVWSYFSRRFVTAAVSYSGVDQIAIATGLLNTAQAVSSGNIGVTVNPDGVTSPVYRDLVLYSFELKPVAEAVTDFAMLEDGFDFAIDVTYDSSGVPTKAWRPSYPRRGRTVAESGWVFEYPGNIVSYAYDEDATDQAIALTVVGADSGTDMATATVVAQDMLDAGFPLLEGTVSYKDSSDLNVLAARARSESAASKATVTVPQINVRADMDPVLGSYIVGDDVRVRITDPRFTTTLDTFQRITTIKVTPPDSANETAEQVTLTLGEAI